MAEFDFDMEFSEELRKYPSITPQRAEEIYQYLTHDHTEKSYKRFMRELKGEEYFFAFDVEYLLHKRCIERMRNLIIAGRNL